MSVKSVREKKKKLLKFKKQKKISSSSWPTNSTEHLFSKTPTDTYIVVCLYIYELKLVLYFQMHSTSTVLQSGDECLLGKK